MRLPLLKKFYKRWIPITEWKAIKDMHPPTFQSFLLSSESEFLNDVSATNLTFLI